MSAALVLIALLAIFLIGPWASPSRRRATPEPEPEPEPSLPPLTPTEYCRLIAEAREFGLPESEKAWQWASEISRVEALERSAARTAVRLVEAASMAAMLDEHQGGNRSTVVPIEPAVDDPA